MRHEPGTRHVVEHRVGRLPLEGLHHAVILVLEIEHTHGFIRPAVEEDDGIGGAAAWRKDGAHAVDVEPSSEVVELDRDLGLTAQKPKAERSR